jgi:hypothetical protein
MTFLDKLTAHVGGLVRLKTDLYWYNTRSRDGIEGRVFLLLDAAGTYVTGRRTIGLAARTLHGPRNPSDDLAHALLLIDDQAKWIWTSIEDVEFIQ